MSQLKTRLVYSFLIVGLVLLYRFVNRDSLMVVINRSLPEREAGVLAGMLVGEKQAMSKDFYEWLKISGLVHLVIVSGSNVMLLSKGLIEGLAGYLGRKKTIIIVLVVAWSYAGMVRWEIPVVRAVLLVTIYYWAQILGKRFEVWRALILVVVIMMAADWKMVEGVSFWLSILAFTAIISNNQKTSIPNNDQLPMLQTLKSDLLTTVWVSVWITPILAISFGKISLISPLTNVAVLFLVETITLVGAIGAVVGVFWLEVGRMIIMVIYPLLRYFVWVVEIGSKWAQVEVRFNWWILTGWYLILGWWLMRRNNAK